MPMTPRAILSLGGVLAWAAPDTFIQECRVRQVARKQSAEPWSAVDETLFARWRFATEQSILQLLI
jgi:hypothetical protein